MDIIDVLDLGPDADADARFEYECQTCRTVSHTTVDLGDVITTVNNCDALPGLDTCVLVRTL